MAQGEAQKEVAELKNVSDKVFGFRCFFLWLFNNRLILLQQHICIELAEYLLASSYQIQQLTTLGSALHIRALSLS